MLYIVDKLFQGYEKSIVEGAAFATAILPRIHTCNLPAAFRIYANMRIRSTSPSQKDVQESFEKTYNCMGITCDDVGSLQDPATGAPYPKAACISSTFPTVAPPTPSQLCLQHHPQLIFRHRLQFLLTILVWMILLAGLTALEIHVTGTRLEIDARSLGTNLKILASPKRLVVFVAVAKKHLLSLGLVSVVALFKICAVSVKGIVILILNVLGIWSALKGLVWR